MLNLLPVNRGPSPRAWGKREQLDSRSLNGRTIPTCVGKTVELIYASAANTDHPHVRGENFSIRKLAAMETGPSPRAWGKRNHRDHPMPIQRTIPTCVGKTQVRQQERSMSADHPHVRGENSKRFSITAFHSGPSPRAWGKHYKLNSRDYRFRTIPTCVGKT